MSGYIVRLEFTLVLSKSYNSQTQYHTYYKADTTLQDTQSGLCMSNLVGHTYTSTDNEQSHIVFSPRAILHDYSTSPFLGMIF